MTGDDFLTLAVELFTRNRAPSEALCRTIVSRAYYGAFHIARDYMARLGFPETDKHRLLADSLSASGVTDVIRAGDLLRTLATFRGRADYDIKQPHVSRQLMDAQFLKSHIERADEVRDLLKQASTPDADVAARRGMQAYWRAARG